MILILMGVAGSGKTTVGRLLASRLGCDFVDADDYHPAQNRLKMQNGIPLSEEDRAPWLETLAGMIRSHLEKRVNMVLACSALRNAYRAKLGIDQKNVRSVYLDGTREELISRLAHRKHEFFNPSLLDSQLAALEEPDSGLVLKINQPAGDLVDRIVQWVDET